MFILFLNILFLLFLPLGILIVGAILAVFAWPLILWGMLEEIKRNGFKNLVESFSTGKSVWREMYEGFFE